MTHDKRIFLDKLNKCIWELQVVRNMIEEDHGFPVDRAHKAFDSLGVTSATIKSLSKELHDVYKQDLTWQ